MSFFALLILNLLFVSSYNNQLKTLVATNNASDHILVLQDNTQPARVKTKTVVEQKVSTLNSCQLLAPQRVLKDILAQDAIAVSSSPTGHRILAKFKHAHSYELQVRDLEDSTKISTSSSHSQVALSWSPDGNAIAYMARVGAGKPFHLYLWHLDTNKVEPIAAPESEEATSPIKWSPKGDRFLYAIVINHIVTLKLLMLTANPSVKNIAEISGSHGYSWTADGHSFFAVKKESPDSVSIFDDFGRRTKEVPVQGVGEIDSMVLSQTGRQILVSARKPSEPWLRIISIDRDSAKQKPCLSFNGDLRLPIPLPSGEMIVAASFDDRTILAKARCGEKLKFIGPNEGWVIGDVLGSNARILYASYVSTRRPGVLISIDIPTGKFITTFRTREAFTLEIPPPERITITSANGDLIHGLVWKTQHPSPFGHRVVVSAHGGGSAWFILQQIVLAAGGDYVVIQDRSTAGFGNAFEDHYNVEPHVDDILRGVEYAIRTLHPLNGKVILEGSSYGAYLATRVARKRPDLLEALVVESMTGHDPSHETFTPSTKPLTRIYQFHGDSDPGLSPEDAKREIELILGDHVTNPPSGCFYVFQNEGHTIQDSANVATMWGILASIIHNPPNAPVVKVASTR